MSKTLASIVTVFVALVLALGTSTAPASASPDSIGDKHKASFTKAPPKHDTSADIMAHSKERKGVKKGRASIGGCGFLQACVFFNRSEQDYVANIGVGAGGGFICAVTAGLGCAAAGAVATAMLTYIGHNGVCRGSTPRMMVKVFPVTWAEARCVA